MFFLMIAWLLKVKGVAEHLKAAKHAKSHLNGFRWILVGPIDDGNLDGIAKIEFVKNLKVPLCRVNRVGWYRARLFGILSCLCFYLRIEKVCLDPFRRR